MRREQNKEATVYVGNLHERLTPRLLHELMLNAGRVRNVNMPVDRVNGQHQGFGFVEFHTEEEADYAPKVMNNVALYGSRIRVNKASADKQRNIDIGAELFIGNLDAAVDEKTLYDTFGRFGPLANVPKIAHDEITNISKGYGFISYGDFESSEGRATWRRSRAHACQTSQGSRRCTCCTASASASVPTSSWCWWRPNWPRYDYRWSRHARRTEWARGRIWSAQRSSGLRSPRAWRLWPATVCRSCSCIASTASKWLASSPAEWRSVKLLSSASWIQRSAAWLRWPSPWFWWASWLRTATEVDYQVWVPNRHDTARTVSRASYGAWVYHRESQNSTAFL
jgi:hypothetical protein